MGGIFGGVFLEAILFIAFLIFLLLIGMPIGFSLIVVGSIGIYSVGGMNAFEGLLSTTAFSSVNGFTLTTIPMFILMAYFISHSRIAEDLFDAVIKWIGHYPGGVGVSTIYASAGFGALSGSSVAATSIMSKICIPEMVKANYSDKFSAGMVATCTGTLAVLIPPSVPLILYGVQTENSIGQLLIAGILPGILLAFLLTIYIIFYSLKTNNRTNKVPIKERLYSLKNVWPMALLILLIIVVIYFGVATTTEAGAIGAFGAMLIGLLMKRLNLKSIIKALVETTFQTSMIFTIVLGGHLFSYYITLTNTGQKIITAIHESGLPTWSILVLIIIFYLVLGLFMDMVGSLLLTLPLIYPLIIGLGYDPIWFGIIVVLLLEIGLVTPPVGINLFITSNYSGVPVKKVFFGSLPFIAILLLLIVILIIFPDIVLYLPTKM